jgi:putative hydrolase
MIDLHTHTLLSDGELLPSELARRAKVKGYSVIGISDHVDASNIETVVPSILKMSENAASYGGITVLPGVEITHVPPNLIGDMILLARRLGIFYVVVHGETLSEPVEEGTNRAGILGGADILAHPGLVSEEEMILAKERGVLIEISARKGHCLANGHVAALARKVGVRLVIDTDSHSPSDLITDEDAKRVVMGAGLSEEDFTFMQGNALERVQRIVRGRT